MKVHQFQYRVDGDQVTLYYRNPESGMKFEKGKYEMTIKYVSFCNEQIGWPLTA